MPNAKVANCLPALSRRFWDRDLFESETSCRRSSGLPRHFPHFGVGNKRATDGTESSRTQTNSSPGIGPNLEPRRAPPNCRRGLRNRRSQVRKVLLCMESGGLRLQDGFASRREILGGRCHRRTWCSFAALSPHTAHPLRDWRKPARFGLVAPNSEFEISASYADTRPHRLKALPSSSVHAPGTRCGVGAA